MGHHPGTGANHRVRIIHVLAPRFSQCGRTRTGTYEPTRSRTRTRTHCGRAHGRRDSNAAKLVAGDRQQCLRCGPKPGQPIFGDNGQHLTVEVVYCVAEEEDSVDPEHFCMLHAAPVQIAHVDDGLVEDPLEARELTVGRCAPGNLGFFVLSHAPSDFEVEYRPGDLGSLTWTVEEVE